MIEDYFTASLSLSQKASQYKNDNDGGNNYSGLMSAIVGWITVDLLLPHRLSRPEAHIFRAAIVTWNDHFMIISIRLSGEVLINKFASMLCYCTGRGQLYFLNFKIALNISPSTTISKAPLQISV